MFWTFILSADEKTEIEKSELKRNSIFDVCTTGTIIDALRVHVFAFLDFVGV